MGEKDDTITCTTYEPKYDPITKSSAKIDFTKGKNDRNLWEQKNDKFNQLIEKDNPGAGTYNVNKESNRGVTSSFRSNTKKMQDIKVLNENISYLQDTIESKSKDKLHDKNFIYQESRDMQWMHNHEIPYSKPEHLMTPGPQTYKTKKDKMVRINSQPFNCSTKRKLNEVNNSNPGPGDYNPVSTIGKKMNAKDLKISGKNPSLLNYMGGKGKKNEIFKISDNPAPNTYDVKLENKNKA